MTEPGSSSGHSQSYNSYRKRGETKSCDMQSMHEDGFNSSRGEPNNTASTLNQFPLQIREAERKAESVVSANLQCVSVRTSL